MPDRSSDKNLELAQRELAALLEKRQFGPGRVSGDYVTFTCHMFSLNLVFYRADVWAEVYQNQHPDDAIALSNLLQFLRLPTKGGSTAFPPDDGSNTSAWKLKRISSIAADVDAHFDALGAFFCEGDLVSKQAEVKKFVIARNPHLFRRIGDP